MKSSEPFIASYNGSDLSRSVDSSKHRDRWINIQRMIKAKRFLLHAMKSHLDPSNAIGRSSRRDDDFINGHVIATIDRDEHLHPTAAPKNSSFKCSSSRRKELPVDFRQIRFVQSTISRVVCSLVLLMHVRIH